MSIGHLLQAESRMIKFQQGQRLVVLLGMRMSINSFLRLVFLSFKPLLNLLE